MAKVEPKLDKYEFNKLVNQWVAQKKVSPSKMDRLLSYKIYNQLFNGKQRSADDCNCHDRDVDYKVTRELERYLNLEPLPIESNVKIDFSSMTNDNILDILDEEEEEVVTPIIKKRSVRSKKTINDTEDTATK